MTLPRDSALSGVIFYFALRLPARFKRIAEQALIRDVVIVDLISFMTSKSILPKINTNDYESLCLNF